MREFWFGVFGSILGVLAGAALLAAAGLMLVSNVAAAWLEDAGLAAPRTEAGSERLVLIDLRSPDLAVLDALEALHHAARDPNTAGALVLAGGDRSLSTAEGEALSRALTRLAQSGRHTTGHLEDAAAAGLPAYLALSPAEAIWASPFAVIRSGTALSAGLSERSVQENVAEQLVQMIASARGYPAERIGARLAQGPLIASAALESGLIDQLGSAAAAQTAALSSVDGDLIAAAPYLRSARNDPADAHVVLLALDEPVSSAAAARLVTALDAAAASSAVRAVILYTDSAGGSVPAAFEIADAIQRSQAAGTPVVAVAGSAAHGAGYFAIAPADRIVTAASAVLAGLGTPDSRLPASLGSRPSPEADTPSARIANARYAAMLEGVARARDLPLARIDALSRGQVWSGQEAVAYGLADHVGGLDDALQEARRLAGIASDEPLGLVRVRPDEPAPQTALTRALGPASP